MIPDNAAWFQPVTLAQWPTQPAENLALRYRLPLHAAWTHRFSTDAANEDFPLEHYQGQHISEGLSVQCIKDADPEADLSDWVSVAMHMLGHPLEALPKEAQAQLLEFRDDGPDEALAQVYGVDVLHHLGGLVQIRQPERALARFYVVMARRQRWAWKFTLSFMSACQPGTAEELVIRNDHVRAGASFGGLQLLPL